ncbi:MAG TPA: DUF5916 domain-containing protein, partial [Balneolaceae bacterium]|nr:DUF5916 domain-containing protein [Balneolaceae bacterium]
MSPFKIKSLLVIVVLVMGSFSKLAAQGKSHPVSKSSIAKSKFPTLKAVRLSPKKVIHLDGQLDEPIWENVPIATGFIQRSPHDGEPASEKTEVRVIYTDKALYVGIKAYDDAMDSVAATLFRKDGEAYSDWVYVNIDSYDDNRTSFSFAVNPRGVRKDILTFNNDNEDTRWDAVWEAKTTIQKNCWVAELRIPLSQLRFNEHKKNQTWGINFQRRLARKDEISFWSPTPQDASGYVSRYGKLTGIKNLHNISRLEVTPYMSGSLTRAPGQSANPFYNYNDLNGNAGADIKYGLTSDFTLTGTINPDFGQVEADPAVINLSAFETYFPEQRPFFLEGTDIFEFGRTKTFNTFGNPIVFYSRRIGRRPQGQARNANSNVQYVDAPDQTTIASAAKISGKTENGFSLGILDAFTTREKAHFRTTTNKDGSISVEPPSNYFVGRIKQDFHDGSTIIGAYGSSVNRFIGANYLNNTLHKSSYIGGVDFEQGWNDREWILSGTASLANVSGSRESIRATQKSSARYYNRVDADYLSVDPNKTSLSGFAGELSFAKYGGEHWKGSFTYSVVTPGYEVNDIGFENRADYHALSYYVSYQESSPKFFRYYEFWAFAGHTWNFGGDLINHYYRTGGYFQFNDLWSFNYNTGFNGKQYDDRLTRGGPVAKSPESWNVNFNINSDQTKKVSFNIGAYIKKNVAGGYIGDYWTNFDMRPATFIQLSISPELVIERHNDQYVNTFADPNATQTYYNRYVFADLDQTSLYTKVRLDWTFTPEMSLQTYVRPFITSGNFYQYKEFTKPRGYDFTIYGKDRGTIQKQDNIYIVDPDGSGPAQSFSFKNQ